MRRYMKFFVYLMTPCHSHVKTMLDPTNVIIDDVGFESRIVISLSARGINRIVETATNLDTIQRTTRIDVMVRRE